METKINIAEILKDKPQGTKLYSRICGAVELKKVIDVRKKKSIVVKELNSNNQHRFWHDGNFFRAGQCVLQPSENMANWSKFLWKKGDVLQNNDYNTQVIFDRFTSDTYEMIRCKYWLKVDNGIERFIIETNVLTKDYFKVSEELSQCYINKIENRCGGKLNLETLEIEKKTKFEDGDIAFADYGNRQYVFIVSGETGLSEGYNSSIYLDLSSPTSSIAFRTSFFKKDLCELRLATEEEKKQLFDALAKKGKAWDAEKKQIVDLKPKCEFKPFDKVLGRNEKDDVWEAELFSHYKEESQYPFRCIGFSRKYCIPYNEETAHLLGTTDDWKGGEHD
nr:MAG TPA: hypothetical protein [Caudoviricetes sp.]